MLTKTSKFLCLLALACLTQVSLAADSDLHAFETKVHPFLRKNCSECHSETAIYPQGPAHSHSQASQAFSTFNKYFDAKAPMTSRFFTFASNQHFCKRYDYNCEVADQVIVDLKTSLESYMQSLSLAPVTPVMGATVPAMKSFTQLFPQKHKNISVSLTFDRINDTEYVKLRKILVVGPKLQRAELGDLRLKVDGQALKAATGLENYRRQILFNYGATLQGKAVKTFSTATPTIKLPKGSKLDVELAYFKTPIVHQSDVSCTPGAAILQNIEQLYTSYKGQIDDQNIGIPSYLTGEKKLIELCKAIVSEIDFANLKKSPLLAGIPNKDRGTLLRRLQNLNTEVPTQAKALKLLEIQAGQQTSCAISEDRDLYCWGAGHAQIARQSNDTNDPRKVDLGFKVKTLMMNYGHTCLLNMEGVVYCAGNNEENELGSKSYDGVSFNSERVRNFTRISISEKVESMRMSYQATCFATVDKKIYCSGGDGGAFSASKSREADMVQVNVPPTFTDYGVAYGLFCYVNDAKLYCFNGDLPGVTGSRPNIMSIWPDRHIEMRLEAGTGVSSIAMNYGVMCYATLEHQVYCAFDDFARFNKIYEGSKIDFSVGLTDVCLKTESAEILCAGSNARNMLGANITRDQALPLMKSKKVVSVGLSYEHSCFIYDDGSAGCAGINERASLGYPESNGNGNNSPLYYRGEIPARSTILPIQLIQGPN